MKQFEYKIYKVTRQSMWSYKVDFEKVEQDLNELGKKGWEVVTSTKSDLYEKLTTGVFIILKKEL